MEDYTLYLCDDCTATFAKSPFDRVPYVRPDGVLAGHCFLCGMSDFYMGEIRRSDTGEDKGGSVTKEMAKKHMAAMYAHAPDVKKGK